MTRSCSPQTENFDNNDNSITWLKSSDILYLYIFYLFYLTHADHRIGRYAELKSHSIVQRVLVFLCKNMQLLFQKAEQLASTASLLASKYHLLGRVMADNMRNAICAKTQTSKVPKRVGLLYISLFCALMELQLFKSHSDFNSHSQMCLQYHLSNRKLWVLYNIVDLTKGGPSLEVSTPFCANCLWSFYDKYIRAGIIFYTLP